MFSSIMSFYKGFVGNGFFLAFYFVALMYLFFTEKDKLKRYVVVYLPMILLLLFFNPLVLWVLERKADGEIYYRMLWILPMAVTVSYAVMQVVMQQKGCKRVLLFVLMIGILAASGDYVYDNPYFSKAQNAYHVPQTVVDICDEIIVEGREVCAVFPNEFLQYVRQYTPYVCMPYGRDMIVDRWNMHHPIFHILQEEEIDVERLGDALREYGCHYLIISTERKLSASMESIDYKKIKEIDGYAIYLDENANLSIQ